jgi:hypothetical protein
MVDFFELKKATARIFKWILQVFLNLKHLSFCSLKVNDVSGLFRLQKKRGLNVNNLDYTHSN